MLQKYYKMLGIVKGGRGVFRRNLKKIILGGMLSVAIISTGLGNTTCNTLLATEESMGQVEDLRITSIKFDKAYPQIVGTSVVLSAECSGGTGEYAYTYTVLLPDGTHETIAESSDCNYMEYTFEEEGIYNFEVRVDDGVELVTEVIEYVVTQAKVSIDNVKLNKKKFKKNDKVKFTVKVTAATGTARSKIVVKTPSGKKVTVKKYSTKKTATYKLKEKGKYKVTIYAKDGSTTAKVKKTVKVS